MNIFITGATGFIGNNLLARLLAVLNPGDKCYILQRRDIQQFSDERIIRLYGNLEDIRGFKKEILNCDYFFHLAANAVFGSDFDYDKANYEPTVQIIDILKGSSCLKNFIFTSTIGAVDRNKDADCKKPLTTKSIPSPTSLYGKSKLKSEEYIVKSGIPFTFL
ncbi:MAG: NAD(P)-dependent oxidoreductase [Nitrospirae bacterium]|nr:NAD(P)-dependent oxidoreductase [Nitrospirota bacterium]